MKLEIYNLALTAADTEYFYTFDEDVLAFNLHRRDGGTVRLYYKSGDVEHYTFSGHLTVDFIRWNQKMESTRKIYVQSPDASQTLEILMWVRG